jgi:hypothetical protein
MLVETLRADWTARGTNARVSALPVFDGGALTLGAGTNLAEAGGDEAADERAVALVSVAIGRPLDAAAATHVQRALAKARAGDAPLALTHLALAGAGRLTEPREDARRLFIADGLMKAGVPPRTILETLGGDDRATLDRAYNPDQPRVPAGSGRASGQWTSGDDGGDGVASRTSASQDTASEESRSVQIADDSDDWLQYLSPIGSAEAAESGAASFNGVGPNAQHQAAVAEAMAAYQAKGFILSSKGAVAVNVPGFPTPRVYDFVVQDPVAGAFIGVEVKTTMYDTVALDLSQVDKDVALYETGGGLAPALGVEITRVAYEAFCAFCPMINLRSAALAYRLFVAGIRVRAYQYPGQDVLD